MSVVAGVRAEEGCRDELGTGGGLGKSGWGRFGYCCRGSRGLGVGLGASGPTGARTWMAEEVRGNIWGRAGDGGEARKHLTVAACHSAQEGKLIS